MTHRLDGRVLLASGATHGVGRALVLAAAAAGADVAVLTRQDTAASATCREVVDTVVASGRGCLVVAADLRSETDVQRAVDRVVAHYGRLDLVVNTADAAARESTLDASGAAFRLMIDVNLHGTYLLGRAALPHVLASEYGQVLSVSPPVEMAEDRLTPCMPWSVSKYAATLLTLGWAAEFTDRPFSANTLWPHRPIHEPGMLAFPPRRQQPAFLPTIMGDAVVELLGRPAGEVTGRSLLDAQVLQASGVTDLSSYEWRPTRHLTGARPD